MARPSLRGCLAKVNRADEHIRYLELSIRQFLDTNPYALVVDPRTQFAHQPLPQSEYDRTAAEFRAQGIELPPKAAIDQATFVEDFWLRVHIRHEPPVLEWGARIGEIVHDLRSALDHPVWQLTILNNVAPPFPLPAGSDWRLIEFPITENPSAFGSLNRQRVLTSPRRGGVTALWGINPALLTRFQRLQPWYGRKHPERTDLWCLQELWNIDKHRTIVSLGSIAGYEGLRAVGSNWEWRGPSPEAWRMDVIRRQRLGPFKDKAPLATLRAQPNFIQPLTQLQAYMDMHAIVTFGIAFEPGPPFQGRPVIETLHRLKNAVTAILVQFEPEFR